MNEYEKLAKQEHIAIETVFLEVPYVTRVAERKSQWYLSHHYYSSEDEHREVNANLVAFSFI